MYRNTLINSLIELWFFETGFSFHRAKHKPGSLSFAAGVNLMLSLNLLTSQRINVLQITHVLCPDNGISKIIKRSVSVTRLVPIH